MADRWVPAQRLLGFCHLLAGLFMFGAAWYGHTTGEQAQFGILFTLYSLSGLLHATLALSNSVAYTALTQAGMDTVKDFPPIRVFGTIGFICSMWFVDLMGFKSSELQFVVSGVLSVVLFIYTFTLPSCPVSADDDKKSFVDAFGLRAFTLFRQRKMAIFFIFSMLLGVSLQITNGFASRSLRVSGVFLSMPTPRRATFGDSLLAVAGERDAVHPDDSLLHEALWHQERDAHRHVCLVPALRLAGCRQSRCRRVMFVASMIIYGVAFDFFNISGSLFVDNTTDPKLRSSAQGLFMLMTNGLGATIGSYAAQAVVNSNTVDGVTQWPACWYAFAGYALVVGVAFALVFRPRKEDVSAS